jgi:hypothetical protein
VFAVLSTLPWVGRELYEKKEQALELLLVSIEVFLGKRSKKHHAALRVWALDTPHPQEEVCKSAIFYQIDKTEVTYCLSVIRKKILLIQFAQC